MQPPRRAPRGGLNYRISWKRYLPLVPREGPCGGEHSYQFYVHHRISSFRCERNRFMCVSTTRPPCTLYRNGFVWIGYDQPPAGQRRVIPRFRNTGDCRACHFFLTGYLCRRNDGVQRFGPFRSAMDCGLHADARGRERGLAYLSLTRSESGCEVTDIGAAGPLEVIHSAYGCFTKDAGAKNGTPCTFPE